MRSALQPAAWWARRPAPRRCLELLPAAQRPPAEGAATGAPFPRLRRGADSGPADSWIGRGSFREAPGRRLFASSPQGDPPGESAYPGRAQLRKDPASAAHLARFEERRADESETLSLIDFNKAIAACARVFDGTRAQELFAEADARFEVDFYTFQVRFYFTQCTN